MKLPHKWYFDKFGIDLICGVCGCNMEGMDYTACHVNLKYINPKTQKKIFKGIKKYGSEIYDYSLHYVNVPKSYFREKVIIEDEDGNYEKYVYNYPKKSKIVKCKCCEKLHEYFSNEYEKFPFWVKIIDKIIFLCKKICRKIK